MLLEKSVNIIGAGLAGCEATWQVISAGIRANLYEMRPLCISKAHKTDKFAELVCSNSFRGISLTNAIGLLKEELKLANSLIMQAAEVAKVPAGGCLAVDRTIFSNYIDDKLRNHPLVTVYNEEVTDLNNFLIAQNSPVPTIIATGPLTSLTFSQSLVKFLGDSSLSFFDAISPVLVDDSLDKSKLFLQSRYNKGAGADYLNIPLTKNEYYKFIELLKDGEKFGGHAEEFADDIANLCPFEGCMPIESMLERGEQTLLFGPLKPVGLIDPRTNQKPFAVVQLRQDDLAGKLWNMVGFQTKLKHSEQVRIFKTLPGLENAEFARLGSVHRNTFINSPKFLNNTNEVKERSGLFFAGQITGVEGYLESTISGLVAGINAVRYVSQKPLLSFPSNTATGALLNYISEPKKDFQPMNINYGLIPFYAQSVTLTEPTPNGKFRKLGKDERRLLTAQNALRELKEFLSLVEKQ
ncbi:MAG: methylenetetrahydrofolate--tRNA-(uracil(54)-C(5))-methyltransferase (FADH(2)-oxidizing) TrmFO [Deltaproteobacteria bacterium]|jgi:methylenetetrahydrofolate--tRNA-(uracil-5-)-methyltransferase|nr:methylenetetrahydrofolate--tRNA-(uracil(54)-C(5))-methyltransferase (FADH(2)-oxidizing) TrmFO [Deltaproteobacteria bacterium]